MLFIPSTGRRPDPAPRWAAPEKAATWQVSGLYSQQRVLEGALAEIRP
jgi:hypothetical protein